MSLFFFLFWSNLHEYLNSFNHKNNAVVLVCVGPQLRCFFSSLTFMRTFCTSLVFFCYSPVVTSPNALRVFIINAPLISTSLRGAGWVIHLGFNSYDANVKPLRGLGLVFCFCIRRPDGPTSRPHTNLKVSSAPHRCQRQAVHPLGFPGTIQCYCELQWFSIILVQQMHVYREYNAHSHLTNSSFTGAFF